MEQRQLGTCAASPSGAHSLLASGQIAAGCQKPVADSSFAQSPLSFCAPNIAQATATGLGGHLEHLIGDQSHSSTKLTGDLLANLVAQLQAANGNSNHREHFNTLASPMQHQQPMPMINHNSTTLDNAGAAATNSEAQISGATLLANMLATGKAMASSEHSSSDSTTTTTPSQQQLQNEQLTSILAAITAAGAHQMPPTPSTTNSGSPPGDSSNKHQQFNQMRGLNNLHNHFFPHLRRLNPFDPFNPIDLAAQALDLSCVNPDQAATGQFTTTTTHR